MPPDQECFGAGAKVRPEARQAVAQKAGTLLPMQLTSGREVIVIVPGTDSEARKAGDDLYFQTCSEDCCQQLTEALRNEFSQTC